jgi:hypothetical protein
MQSNHDAHLLQEAWNSLYTFLIALVGCDYLYRADKILPSHSKKSLSMNLRDFLNFILYRVWSSFLRCENLRICSFSFRNPGELCINLCYQLGF